MSEETSELRKRFWDDGYVVVDELIAPDECDAFNRHMSSVVAGVADEYVEGKRTEFDFWKMLHSARTSFEVMFSRMKYPKMLRDVSRGPPCETNWEPFLERMGGLHFRTDDDRMRSLCHQERMVDVMKAIIDDPVIVTSSIVYKQPGDAMKFPLHQDSSYLPSEPDTLANAFIALDPMNEENGGLYVVPGSHKEGLSLWKTTEKGFEPLGEQAKPDRSRAIMLNLKRGSVVFFHGRLWHGSEPNQSGHPRRSLILICMSRHSKMQETTWIKEPPGGFMAL